MYRNDVIDTRPECMEVPKLFKVMRTYMEEHPEVMIDDIYMSEFVALKAYRPPPMWKPINNPWNIF